MADKRRPRSLLVLIARSSSHQTASLPGETRQNHGEWHGLGSGLAPGRFNWLDHTSDCQNVTVEALYTKF